MEVEHKDFIDKNYMLFTELLRLKSIPLIRYLYDEQIITEEQATKTMSQAAHTLRAMHLLDNMLKLPSEAFDSLYAAILYTKLWRAADLLEPKKRPHLDMEGPHIPLPEEWPDESYFKELTENGLKIENVDKDDNRMEEWYEKSSKNNIYEMKGTIKGRVLIINNYNFVNPKQTKRLGSDKDVEGLKNLFNQLGFEVQDETDLTSEKMREVLDKECRRDHTNYKCFFLILMSHGAKGVVYGTDGYSEAGRSYNCLNIENIKNQFYNVKSLERKPKVFIIQACQGTGKDAGLKEKKAEDEEDDKDIEEEIPIPIEPSQPNKDGNNTAPDGNEAVTEGDNQGNAVAEGGLSDDEDEEDDDEASGPSRREEYADTITAEAPFHFLVAMATTEGNLSFRNKGHGSWFIQAFIFVVSKYAKKEDLLTLMEKVNELVRKAKTETDKRQTKAFLQVSEITNTFIKRYFFFPGMPLEKSKRRRQKVPPPPLM